MELTFLILASPRAQEEGTTRQTLDLTRYAAIDAANICRSGFARGAACSHEHGRAPVHPQRSQACLASALTARLGAGLGSRRLRARRWVDLPRGESWRSSPGRAVKRRPRGDEAILLVPIQAMSQLERGESSVSLGGNSLTLAGLRWDAQVAKKDKALDGSS